MSGFATCGARLLRKRVSHISGGRKRLCALHVSCWGDEIEKNEMGGACGAVASAKEGDADRTYLRYCPVRAWTRLRFLEGARDRRWL